MNRFDAFREAMRHGAGVIPWRHELVGPSGKILATTDADQTSGSVIHWGCTLAPLATDQKAISQRSARAVVLGTVADLVPGEPGDLLHPDTGNRVRSWCGLVLESGTEYWAQSTLYIDEAEPSGVDGAVTIDLQLVDAVTKVRSDFTDSFAFSDGEMVETVLERILLQVLPADQVSVTATGWTVPGGSVAAGESRFDLVDSLLAGCGHELAVTPTGVVYNRPIPATTKPAGEGWRFGPGELPMGLNPTVPIRGREPRGWVVEAGALQTSDPEIQAVVYDRDPQSLGFFQGGGAVTLETARLPWVKSESQARVAGYGQMRRNGQGPGSIRFTTTPNPAMVEGDLIVVTADHLKASGDYLVRRIDLPPQVDGEMTVEARRVWDPEIGFEPPAIDVPPDTNCWGTHYSDDFDRDSQNLEILPGRADGSPEWTEVGRSWNVVNRRAVQVVAGEWSMAFLNIPLCRFDSYAAVDVDLVPDGLHVGPAVRVGADGSGYVALTDSAGRVSLEVWQNLQRQDVIGSFDTGGSMVSRNLRIEAVGSEISVKVDGATVITASDDRRTERRAGMMADGNRYPNSPSISRFTAGPIE